VAQSVSHLKAVIARLDRAIQYPRAPMFNRNALEYWITRFRG
jgi:hypothetical protein